MSEGPAVEIGHRNKLVKKYTLILRKRGAGNEKNIVELRAAAYCPLQVRK